MSNKQVNHFIREWRKYRGFSVRTLAQHAGLAPSTVGGLETGNAQYSQASLESIAKALGATPAAILAGPPQGVQDIAEASFSTGVDLKPSAAWQLIIDGQHHVALEIFKADMEKAVERASNDMFKRMTKELRTSGWRDVLKHADNGGDKQPEAPRRQGRGRAQVAE